MSATSGRCRSAYSSSRSAWARSPDRPRPDTTQGTTGNPPPGVLVSTAGGACSRLTCALVPLIPNEEGPYPWARRA